MKTSTLILIAFLFILKSNAQLLPVPTNSKNNVYFWYDENGNRLKRQITIMTCGDLEVLPDDYFTFNADKRNVLPPLTLKDKGEIQIFPNPTIENVHISIHTLKLMENASLYVRNIDGKIIYTKQYVINNSEEIIPFENFITGSYIVSLKLNSTETLSWKVIKN